MPTDRTDTTAPAEPDTTRDLTAVTTAVRALHAAGWKADYAYEVTDGTAYGLIHPSGREIAATMHRHELVTLALHGLTLDEAVGAVAGAGLAPEPTAEDEPDPRRTFYNLVAAGVAAGLPIPARIHIPDDHHIATVWLGDDNPDAVDRWAAHLGLPPADKGSEHTNDSRSWWNYKAETWAYPAIPGWCVRAESYVTVPAALAVQGGESR